MAGAGALLRSAGRLLRLGRGGGGASRGGLAGARGLAAAGGAGGAPAFGELFREGRPRVLALDRPPLEAAVEERGPWLYGAALRAFGFFSRESVLVRGARNLCDAATARGTSPEFHAALGLEADFRAQHAMVGLHVWMLLVRLRRRGDEATRASEDLYRQFQLDTERRVYKEGVRVRVSKWLKELEKIFLGQCLALDKALEGDKGDLEVALRKNVFAGEGDRQAAAALARYVRRELASLEMTDLDAVLIGDIAFNAED